MGKGGGTIGYHYIMTLLAALGRAGIDELVEIVAGDEVAWSGSVTDDTPTAINAPDLFGGEQREGGIQGAFRLMQGADSQVLPAESATVTVGSKGPVKSTTVPDIKALIAHPMGELRGITTLIYDGLVASMSPYPKEWKFRKRRALQGWYGGAAWYPDKAVIHLTGDGSYVDGAQGPRQTAIKAMNPAHIVYQVLTDPLWGAGQPVDSLDENSFIAAANTLCGELFGLCLNWARQEDVEQFIQVVMDHVAGAVYRDPQTGLWTLRLIRDDYVLADLPVYTFASGLLSIEDEDNAGGEESFNEIRVTGTDPVTNLPFEVFAQTLAALQDDGAEPISDSIEYKGIPTRALALRVAERDLRPHAAGLKRYRLTFDRRAWTMTPAMPFRVQAPERGIADIVLRLNDIDYGTPGDPKITVGATEDMFGLSASAFGTVVAGTPASTSVVPLPAAAQLLLEANYRDLYRIVGAAQAGAVPDTSGHVAQYARAGSPVSPTFDLAAKVTGETSYTYTPNEPFSPSATLAAAIGPADTTITLAGNTGIDSDMVGEALHLGGAGGEIVRLDALAGSTATIARGCADTVPSSHAAGAVVWPLDDSHGVDAREYAVTEQVTTLVLSRTRSGLLAEGDATPETLTVAGRHALPYPPGQVTVDGSGVLDVMTAAPPLLSGVYPEPVFAWAHRDRLTQADQLVAFVDGPVGPEAGVTYRVRIYDPADLVTPLRTTTGIAGTTWTYDATMQGADGAPPRVRVKIDSQRDGLDSWQAVEFELYLDAGYGLGYGLNYGGA